MLPRPRYLRAAGPRTLNKSRLGRGNIHYQPRRAILVHAPCSGSPVSSRMIELNPYEAAPRQGGIVPSYALIVREYFPAREAGARVSLVLMTTVSIAPST